MRLNDKEREYTIGLVENTNKMGEINSKRTDTSPNEQRDPSEVVSITCLILDHSIRSGFRIS